MDDEEISKSDIIALKKRIMELEEKSYCHIREKKMITDTDLFIFMDDNSDLFDITKMCKVFNLTRSSYYNFLKTETRNSEIKKQSIKELIKKIW